MVAGAKVRLIRNDHLTNNLLVLDGLTGTGKTMISSVLQSFDRVENGRFIYDLDYIAISSYLGAHREDSVCALLDLVVDWKLYDNLISREINLRPSDLSSIFRHPQWFEYIRRLFQKDGASATHRLELKNPIMMVITHQLALAMEPLRKQFRDRIKIVEMVRHPYYLLDHWIAALDILSKTPRDFTVWVEDQTGAPVPWFAHEWRNRYWSLSSFDRAVLSIDSLSKHHNEMTSTKIQGTNFVVPFESFVLRTDDYLTDLAKWIGTSTTKHTHKICRKQNLPRTNINAGLNKSIYRRYNYNDAEKYLSHQQSYMQKKEFADSQKSSISGPILKRLVSEYEERFGLWF